jgi:hypothetical protein
VSSPQGFCSPTKDGFSYQYLKMGSAAPAEQMMRLGEQAARSRPQNRWFRSS